MVIKTHTRWKLGQRGISHLITLGLVVVVTGLIGTFMLVASHASDAPCNVGYNKVNNRCRRIKKPKKDHRSTRQKLAASIIKQADQGKLQLGPTEYQDIDSHDHTTPRQNIESASSGRRSLTTRNCAGRDGIRANKSSVYLNIKLLKFMNDLGDSTHYRVTAISGQCHKSSTSQHYKGKALDIGCPFSASQLETARRVGARYGITNNSESCTNGAGHYHFSIGGK